MGFLWQIYLFYLKKVQVERTKSNLFEICAEAQPLLFKKVQVERIKSNLFEVCAEAQPLLFKKVQVERTKSNLFEICAEAQPVFTLKKRKSPAFCLHNNKIAIYLHHGNTLFSTHTRGKS